MRPDPLVSVVIPTFNRANLVCGAVESVLGQTYRRRELLVVDDGSTDDTLDRLRSFGNRVRIISQANAGAASARNVGIRASSGEVLAFLDSDDLWLPTKLERQIDLLHRAGDSVACCLCNAVFRSASTVERTLFGVSLIETPYPEGIWRNPAEVLATRFVLFNQMVAVRRETLLKIGLFDESLRYLEDYELAFRLALAGPWAFIRDPLVVYRQGSAGSLADQSSREPIELKRLELRIFEDLLERAAAHPCSARIQQLLRVRWRVIRCGLLAARWRSRSSLLARFGAVVLDQLHRRGYAAFKRSPWSPKAETEPVLPNNSHLESPEAASPIGANARASAFQNEVPGTL